MSLAAWYQSGLSKAQTRCRRDSAPGDHPPVRGGAGPIHPLVGTRVLASLAAIASSPASRSKAPPERRGSTSKDSFPCTPCSGTRCGTGRGGRRRRMASRRRRRNRGRRPCPACSRPATSRTQGTVTWVRRSSKAYAPARRRASFCNALLPANAGRPSDQRVGDGWMTEWPPSRRIWPTGACVVRRSWYGLAMLSTDPGRPHGPMGAVTRT